MACDLRLPLRSDQLACAAGFRPGGGCQVFDVAVSRVWDPLKDICQVGVRINSPSAAAFDDRKDNRASVAGIGSAYKSSNPEGVSPSGFSQNRT